MIAVYNIAGDRPHNLTAFIIYITIFKSLSELIRLKLGIRCNQACPSQFFFQIQCMLYIHITYYQ